MQAVLHKSLLSKNPQIFLMCCEMRNFSQVARALGLTQSAVSKAIQNFETDLGFTLFIRDCRPLTLTAEAALLEQYLRNMTGDFAQFMTQMQAASFIKPVLHIGITDPLGDILGVEIAKETLPDVSRLLLSSAPSEVLLQRLKERKTDLIITAVQTVENEKISRRKLFTETSILAMPQMISDQCKDWTWERLAMSGLPHIAYSRDTTPGLLNDLYFRTNNLSFPDRISADSANLVMALVRERLGWAVVRPTSVLHTRHMLDEIALRPMPQPALTRDVFLMSREGEFMNEMNLLVDIVQRIYRQKLLPNILAIAPWLASELMNNDSSSN